MTRPSPPRLLAALAAVLAAFAAALPAPLAVAALAVTFLVTPGALLAPPLLGPGRREARVAWVIGLSPFLASGPVAALVAAGVPLAAAARGVALAIALVALVVPPAGKEAPTTPEDAAAFRVAAIAAGAWLALVAALLIGNAFLPPRSDGWFHAGVTMQVLQRGVPPEDPYFAGLRLPYFWGMHVWAASWLALAPRLAVWTPLIAFNLAAAVAVMFAVADLARRLGADARGTGFACALLALGQSAPGWVAILARTMFGEVRGWPELARTLAGGADPVLQTLAMYQLHASMAFFGDKYLVLTQFSLGLALLACATGALLELGARPGPRAAAAFATVLACALFTHTVVGDLFVLLSAATWWLYAARALRGDANARRALPWLLGAVAVAVAAVLPYLLEITAGKGGQFGLGFGPAAFASLFLGGFALFLPGVWMLAGARAHRHEAGVLLLLLAACALLGLGLDLAQNNQSKFFNCLFVLLAAPAGLAWRGWIDRAAPGPRAWRTAALAVLVLPTSLFAVWAFACERAQGADAWKPESAAGREAMAWAAAHTAPDAAFCDLGGGRDVMVMAGRSVLWGGYVGERDWGYAPGALAARRDLVGALCRGRDPGPEGRALLAGLKRDVIVVTRATLPDSLSDGGRVAARPDRFAPLWRNREVAFWRVVRP